MNDETGEHSPGPGLRDEARQAAHAAGEEYGEAREQIKKGVKDSIEGAKHQAQETAEAQQHQIGASIQAIANALQASVDSLRAQGQEAMADYCHTAADGIDDLATRVKDKPLEQMWAEVEHSVREQPGLAFGGAVAAGFLLSRFLKSSSPTPPSTTRGSRPYGTAGAPPTPAPASTYPAREPDYPGPMGG